MMRRRLVITVSILALAFTTRAQNIARAENSDLVLRLGSEVWSNIAFLLPKVALPSQFGDLTIADAIYCEDAGPNAVFVALLEKAPAGSRATSLKPTDCSRSTSEIISIPENASADAAAKIVTMPNSGKPGLLVRIPDATMSQNSKLSATDITVLTAASVAIDMHTFPVAFGGLSDQIQATPDLGGKDLVVGVTQSNLTHPIASETVTGPIVDPNAKIVISHDAIRWITSRYLANKEYAVRGTSFILTQPAYTGTADSVTISGIVVDRPRQLSIAATIIWRGAELKLAEVNAKSNRTCGALDVACRGKLVLETTAAVAFAAAVRARYVGSRLLPNTGSNKVAFQFAERNYSLELASRSVQSTTDRLVIYGNVFLGVEP